MKLIRFHEMTHSGAVQSHSVGRNTIMIHNVLRDSQIRCLSTLFDHFRVCVQSLRRNVYIDLLQLPRLSFVCNLRKERFRTLLFRAIDFPATVWSPATPFLLHDNNRGCLCTPRRQTHAYVTLTTLLIVFIERKKSETMDFGVARKTWRFSPVRAKMALHCFASLSRSRSANRIESEQMQFARLLFPFRSALPNGWMLVHVFMPCFVHHLQVQYTERRERGEKRTEPMGRKKK